MDATTCNACGEPSVEDFCSRVECRTFGGGAAVAGPPILNPRFFPVGRPVRRARNGQPVSR